MTDNLERFTIGRSRRETFLIWSSALVVLGLTVWFSVKFINPAPPSKLVIATGDGEGDYAFFAEKYHDQMMKEGIDLQIRATKGAMENVSLLKDPDSEVTVGFVHDGIVTQEEAPNVASLGSMYYEPLWIFMRKSLANKKQTRLDELVGKTISLGEDGSGTKALALRVLSASGINATNSKYVFMKWDQIQSRLDAGTIDVAFFIGPPEDEVITQLLEDPKIELMDLDNAEAIQRKLPFLHHLLLPHGAIDLAKNLPRHDIDIVAPTATLLVKKNIHPALVHLLLRAATAVHSDAGVFEKANEFPADKDFEIDLNEDARQFFKNGAPAWHRYLPFWLATLFERLIVILVPLFAIVLPALKSIPRFFKWRARRRILRCYAELKYIEVQLNSDLNPNRLASCVVELKKVEEKVKQLKVPLEFADQLYGLRSNIGMVQGQISQLQPA